MRIEELEPILALAKNAGNAVLAVYGRPTADVDIEWKEGRTPLTEADRASNDVIVAGLRGFAPNVPVVSEEGEPLDRRLLTAGVAHWMVDPLDGTKEFLKRTGQFTVNIALIRDGRPVAGVVHAPALGRSWLGGTNGAEGRDGDAPQPLKVRSAAPDRLALVASQDHAGPGVTELLGRVPWAETLSLGSSLKFCLIAEGRADLYLRDGPTMEWDTAAAQAVLEAAGGGVFTLDGRPLRYTKPGFRNPHFVAVGDPGLDWKALVGKARP